MKIVKRILAVLALALLSATLVPGARADEWSKKPVVTFDQPIEIPGQILPAGTYTFALVESKSDRNIVRIFQADGTTVVATILAINNYRLHRTDGTTMKFAERSGDNPEALRAWFYPGDNFGQEFAYPKSEAVQIAANTHQTVPTTYAQNDSELTTAKVGTVDEKGTEQEMPPQTMAQNTPPPATPEPEANRVNP